MSDSDANGLSAINCPRCGYDQRGLIGSWRDSCPLEATCAECGLKYRCAEMILPEKFEPPWCVEYCPGGVRLFVRSCASTFMRSLAPWRFWSRMRMSDRIRPRRIALYLLIIFMCVLFIGIVAIPMASQWMAAVNTWNRHHGQIATEIAEMQARIDMARRHVEVQLDSFLSQWPEEEHERLVNQAEQEIQRWIAPLQQQIDSVPTIEHSLPLAIFEAVLLPFAKSSYGSIVHPDGTIDPYPSPSELRQDADLMFAWWDEAPQAYPFGPKTGRVLVLGTIAFLLFPLTLIMLPMTRQRAKVRWAHIWKVTAYGVVIPLLSVLIATVLLILWSVDVGGTKALVLHVFVSLGFIPLALVAWWTFAIDRYLKMPHALGIGLLHSLVAVLVALAFARLFWPHLIFMTA
jgi:hypothetical protein